MSVDKFGFKIKMPYPASQMRMRAQVVTLDYLFQLKPRNRKRRSASYIVRGCARWERERERERERDTERERDGRDVTIVALKLAMSSALFLAKHLHLGIGEEFCTFLAKTLHLSFSPLEWRFVHTSVAKNVALFETVRIPRTVKWRDRGSMQQNKRSNFRLHRPSHWKNESN